MDGINCDIEVSSGRQFPNIGSSLSGQNWVAVAGFDDADVTVGSEDG